MQRFYEQSNWGWKPKGKLNELKSKLAYYLIAQDQQQDKIIGFCHFRFLLDDQRPVLYVYELQVLAEHRKLGLGSKMLDFLVLIARQSGMRHLMATVFTFNETSLAFFQKHGFKRDFTSPSVACEDADYVILIRDL